MTTTVSTGSVIGTAARFFVDPRASVRAVLNSRPSEGRILAFGMFAAIVLFMRQTADILSRPDLIDDQSELVMQSFVSFAFFVPLAYYLVAAAGTLAAKACKVLSFLTALSENSSRVSPDWDPSAMPKFASMITSIRYTCLLDR